MSFDEITLTVPRQRPFHRVAHLVLGGLAVRLDLTLETLEDLELALDSLLEREDGEGEIAIAHRLEEGAIVTAIGPFAGEAVRAELEAAGGAALGLRRILETVADRVDLVKREGGCWIELTKNVRGGKTGKER